MPVEILMPALSPTMEEGTLSKWLKKEGDKVTSGDVIAEIETDKATMEVEAVDEGVIGKILIDARSDQGAKDVYGGIYPTSVLYATQDYIDANPEVIQKVTNATVRALHWMKAHSAEEIVEKLPDDFVSGDKATYIKAVEAAKAIFSEDGKFEPKDLETPLAVLKSFNEAVAKATIDLNTTYTNKFVEAAASKPAN